MLRPAIIASLCALLPASTSFSADYPVDPCTRDSHQLVAEMEKRGFVVVGQGLSDHGNLVQVLRDPDTWQFAIISSLPAGPGCIVRRGGAFILILPPAGDSR